MKKILSLFLSMALLVPAALTAAPLWSASAETPAAPLNELESVNYAEGISWDEKVGTPTVTATENGAIMTNVSNSWDSPGVDILPAVKAALGDGDYVTVKLVFELELRAKAGAESTPVYVRPLLRGGSNSSASTDSDWKNEYAQSLHGDPTLFICQGGNIMKFFSDNAPQLNHDQPVTYETSMALTRNQVESPATSEWTLCVDSVSPTEAIDSVELRNLSITVVPEPTYGDDVWDGQPPETKDSYTTEIWSPAEIILHSTVEYENPYTATEIDATFTHTDGTQITLPGFWMGGVVWAVRFSPTKVGEWSYTVTCKDADNKGLNAAGKVVATETTGETEIARRGFVTTVKDQRYYQYADGTPFFWLGDTNWQAPTQVSTTICNYPGCDCQSQFHHIVNDRVEKGFTVYQTYFVPEGGNGESGLWLDRAYEKPDTRLFNEKIDGMFEYLDEQGLTIALGLGCHGSTMSVMDLDSFLRFTRYIVARYACYSVVWITGQEITDEGASKTPGYTVFDCYIKAAELVEELDGYKHPNSAHMYPMTADDHRAVRLDTSEWHDSWTLQSGHGYVPTRGYYVDFYNYSSNPQGSGKVKPFIEAEVNYEDINCGGFTGYKKNRLSAWTAMLCGSAGFTYGVTGIWAGCFSTSGYTGWLGATSSYSYEPWYMGVDKPGSFEMSYMKQFFENLGPWYDLIPQFTGSRQANFLGREDSLLSSTEDASVFVALFYGEQTKTGQINALDPEKTYDAYWFNPRTGKYVAVETGIRSEDGRYKIPNKPDSADWVFLLTSLGLPEHYEETPLTDLNPTYAQVAPTGSVVTPVEVTANGGITYSGTPKDAQVMTDHTAWLYDGDPTTVWKPFANQTSQTFLFDLGTAQKLSYVRITPAEGTIIPTFRVEGSNDGQHWTIITDTSYRGVENPGVGNEPLQGTYRYVKVLLLNAEGVYVGDANVDDVRNSLSYKNYYNPMSNHVYPVTEIADILIYTDGQGEPTPEILVSATNAETPEEPETEPVTEPVTEPDTAPAEPVTEQAKPDSPASTDGGQTDGDGQGTTAAPQDKAPKKKGCASVIGAGLTAATIIAAAALTLILRKKD